MMAEVTSLGTRQNTYRLSKEFDLTFQEDYQMQLTTEEALESTSTERVLESWSK